MNASVFVFFKSLKDTYVYYYVFSLVWQIFSHDVYELISRVELELCCIAQPAPTGYIAEAK